MFLIKKQISKNKYMNKQYINKTTNKNNKLNELTNNKIKTINYS